MNRVRFSGQSLEGAAVPLPPVESGRTDRGDVYFETRGGDRLTIPYAAYVPYDCELAFDHLYEEVFPLDAEDAVERLGVRRPSADYLADAFVDYLAENTSIKVGVLQHAITVAANRSTKTTYTAQGYTYSAIICFLRNVNNGYIDWISRE